jgi:predicted short-subunit dehydrogenase-like oxidoreductase (DUF2520 family)
MRKQKTGNRNRPSVAIVGSGRLGTALAIALKGAGYRIEALVARRGEHARRAARKLDAGVLSLAENELEKLPKSRLVLITTPDDVIETVVSRLAQIGQQSDGTVLHTSGALSSAILAPLRKQGCTVGSLHPLVAVSDSSKGAQRLRRAFWCVEGDVSAVRLSRKIVRDLDGASFTVRPDRKALYHAAAVMAAGHLVSLFDLAVQIFVQCGLRQSQAQTILLTLIESSVRNLGKGDPSAALTGSFARGDVATIRRHLEALANSSSSEALETYRVLGLHSIELAEKAGVDPESLNQIRTLLTSKS